MSLEKVNLNGKFVSSCPLQCRKKQFYVDRANQLQKALANMQTASERRLQMEKRFRSQLERDVENLTAQKVTYRLAH